MVEVPSSIGVVGAGTMGAGIAQLAATTGAAVLLHDPDPEALARGLASARAGLVARGERGPDADAITPVEHLGALAPCGLVIEAAPERLELKRALFGELSAIVGESCVLATNTSSLPVSALAGAATHPERVVGMHFFNPAPRMRLVEIVAGADSAPWALELARATAVAMGKAVIDAADVPGFLVNRCNRPFGLEALRVVQEQIASVEQVDRIYRLGGGFRMGPFELMDLVGVDVGFEVSRSFYEQSFGEPRWRPSPLAARLVAALRHGRKTDRGFYVYDADGRYRPPDPPSPPAGGGEGLIVVGGELPVAEQLLAAAEEAGWSALRPEEAEGEVPFLILDCDADPEGAPLQGGPQAILCASGALCELDPGGTAVGFHALAPLDACGLIELTRADATSQAAVIAAERFFGSLGKHVSWVGDAPGLVLGRVLAQLVNEAAFALGEGAGSAADIDAGAVLGLNHPRGPLAWADATGLEHVLMLLDALADHYREERYRAAPLLRRMVAAGRLGDHVGGGFHG